MSKIAISLKSSSESRTLGSGSPKDQQETVSITFKKPGENNPGTKLREIFTWAQKQASSGTGITITFEDNGGEKKSMYIDGDGADRIMEVV